MPLVDGLAGLLGAQPETRQSSTNNVAIALMLRMLAQMLDQEEGEQQPVDEMQEVRVRQRVEPLGG